MVLIVKRGFLGDQYTSSFENTRYMDINPKPNQNQNTNLKHL